MTSTPLLVKPTVYFVRDPLLDGIVKARLTSSEGKMLRCLLVMMRRAGLWTIELNARHAAAAYGCKDADHAARLIRGLARKGAIIRHEVSGNFLRLERNFLFAGEAGAGPPAEAPREPAGPRPCGEHANRKGGAPRRPLTSPTPARCAGLRAARCAALSAPVIEDRAGDPDSGEIEEGEKVPLPARDDGPIPGGPSPPGTTPAPAREARAQRDLAVQNRWGSILDAEREPYRASARRANPGLVRFPNLIDHACLALLEAGEPARFPPLAPETSTAAAPAAPGPRSIAERIGDLRRPNTAAERDEISRLIACKFGDWDYLPLTSKAVNAAGAGSIPADQLARIYRRALAAPETEQGRKFGRSCVQLMNAHGIMSGKAVRGRRPDG